MQSNGLIERQEIFRSLPIYYPFVRFNDVLYPDLLSVIFFAITLAISSKDLIEAVIVDNKIGIWSKHKE